MGQLSQETEEVLDLCLRDQSSQVRDRVVEIIIKSGLQASDPLFLVLALTGQIKAFLQDIPQEMEEGLNAWKSQNKEGMVEISNVMNLLQENQEQQIQKIRQNIEEVNLEFCRDIQAKNSESLQGVSDLVKQVDEMKTQLEEMNSTLQKERASNIKVMKAMIEGLTKTTNDLIFINNKIEKSIGFLKKKILNKWVIGISIFSLFLLPGLLLVNR